MVQIVDLGCIGFDFKSFLGDGQGFVSLVQSDPDVSVAVAAQCDILGIGAVGVMNVDADAYRRIGTNRYGRLNTEVESIDTDKRGARSKQKIGIFLNLYIRIAAAVGKKCDDTIEECRKNPS